MENFFDSLASKIYLKNFSAKLILNDIYGVNFNNTALQK